MSLTAQGTVKNLTPNQVVMIYIEPFTHDASNTPTGLFDSALGPCPVAPDGSWSCSLDVGGPQDYGGQSYIWAAIVSSTQAYDDDLQTTQDRAAFGHPGDLAPPSIGGTGSVSRRLVIRCQQHEKCPANS